MSLLRWVLRWLPAALAVVVLSQLYVRGWLPARAEERRLDACEVDVEARHAKLEQERATLARDEARVDDPIWEERVRRTLLRPEGPLRLESSQERPTLARGE